MPKPIISIKRSTLGTSVVIRSPFSRCWLFNITLAPRMPWDATWVCKRIEWAFGIAVVALFLMGCNNAESITRADANRINVITRYIPDSLDTYPSCYSPWASDSTRDSLIIEGKHYTVSARSRYRAEPEPDTFGDVEAEGPVHLLKPHFYVDTKTADDSILVLNRCGMVWGK